jgi:ligand-binding sensor domain-containing protein/serine phosphatase RsbU (regulator of sigma subunit)
MKSVRSRNVIICIFWCLFLFSSVLNGQSYRFRNYGAANGLSDPYIYTLNQDNSGLLWIGTGTGLMKFNGFDFNNVIFPDSVTNRYASVSLKDKNGNLWFGCNDGSLFYTLNNNLLKLSDLNIQSINTLFETSDGYIWVIPQDKMIIKINENNPSEVTRYYIAKDILRTSSSLSFWSASPVTGGKLLLGTQENLLYCKIVNDSVKIENVVKGIEFAKIQVIQPLNNEGKYLIGVEGEGIFKLSILNDITVLSRFTGHPELVSIETKSIYRDKSGSYWISYTGGLIQINLSLNGELIESEVIYNKDSGMPGENASTVFQDLEGNIWIGFYGDGLSLLPSDAFSFYTPFDKPEAKSIIYINRLNDKYLLCTPSGYFWFNLNTGKPETFINLASQVRQNEILSYHLDNSNRIWIGTKGGGLYLNHLTGGTTQFYRSGNNSEDNIYHIAYDGKNLWLSTLGGVIIIDPVTGNVKKKFRTEDRLPHNSINEILIKKDGDALIGTECDRLYKIGTGFDVNIEKGIMSGNYKNKILCFTESKTNKIWAGTSGNGVFYISNDSVTRFTTENGLLNNYCYSIYADSDNKLWVGHERGFSRLDINTGIIKAFINDFARGGNCNPHAIFETPDGKILIGTTEGMISFDRKKEKKSSSPPINNILLVTINDIKNQFKPLYTLPYKKRNKIVIDYVGISLNNPEKVSYKLKMDNYDDTWSRETFSRQETYNLREGKYKFNMVSVNEDGLSQKTPATFEIIIKKPYWQTWWFFLIVFAVLSGIVALIIYFREKSQREMNEYLESELSERTRVVLKQKDEIELQNIEITDSINYAKRIQSSILPDVNKLKDTFKDAFIIFHPRDIVSGDFYWFDRIDEERFVIVCADSTGHGVPGAFMSMIGSTLLQDIVSRKRITRPSEVLTLLDKQIFSTLNQNIDIGVSNDGMDMVVCEFNIKTRHIRFASAMRPVIIVLEGESYYIRGNRCSVGGEAVVEKFFDDQEYYLSKDDTIYMFSDGLPDQFGGPDGKKMKIARLKKLIEEISDMPMAEQKEVISNFFFDWKGDYEQVDDILLMGIKI